MVEGNGEPLVKLGPFRLLDAWRGVAALIVVAFHWAEIATRRAPELANDPLYAASRYGWLGVQIFFVISGFCIANAAAATLRRGDTLGSYLKARVRRIYPTYWIALAFAVVVMLGASRLASGGAIGGALFTEEQLTRQGPLFWLANVTLTMMPTHQKQILPVAWTLCYEMSFYLVVAAALWASLKARDVVRMLTLLHALTAFCLAVLIVVPEWGRFQFPLELWPQFGLGVLVFDALSRPGQRAPRVWLGLVLGLFALFVALHDVYIGAGFVGSRLSFAVAGLFGVYLLWAHRHDARWGALPWVRPLASVGVYSYSLYLTHTLVIRVVNQGLQKVGLPASLHYVAFAVAVAVAVAAAYLFFLAAERPLLNARKKGPKAAETVKAAVPAPSPPVAAVPGGAE